MCVCSQDRNLGQYVPKSRDGEGLVEKKAYKVLYIILKVIFIANSYNLMPLFVIAPFFLRIIYTSIQYLHSLVH